MSKQATQHRNTVIVARDTGDALEVILRTDDFEQACLTFLDEWVKDNRVCMVDYTPSMIIAACAHRAHLDKQERIKEWSR